MAITRTKLMLCLGALCAMLLLATAAPPTFRQEEMEESVSPTPEESPEDEVCVDATYLSKVPSAHLVHAEHIMAPVLCPKGSLSTLPCATGDHMVRVDGVPTSYRTLCESRACDAKRMRVNSVLSHIWKEEAHADGVTLTMLDARHPEVFQKALHRLTSLRRSVVRSLV